nr:zinc finger, CCHC-type [Tanacetum cinerariifolium]
MIPLLQHIRYVQATNEPIPPAPVAPAGQHVAPEILAAHNAWIKGLKEIVGLMFMTIEPEIQQNLEPIHAHEMLRELKTIFAQQAEQELLQTMRDFHSCRQEVGQSVSSYVLKMKGYIDNLERLGHPVTLGLGYLAELLKKKKSAASGAGGSGIFVIELNTILNRSWIYDTGCGTHICNTTQGLRASRKLKPRALSLSCQDKEQATSSPSLTFLGHLKDHGIIAHRTPPYTPQ